MNTKPLTLYIDFLADSRSGWGNYARNIIKHCYLKGISVISIGQIDPTIHQLSVFDRRFYIKFIEDSKIATDKLAAGEDIIDPSGILLTHMEWGDGPLRFGYDHLKVFKKIGVVFFENLPQVKKHAKTVAMNMDYVVCASNWNTSNFKKYGNERTVNILQGVDTNYFYPRIAPLINDERFYIFSGGKLELRKGQDIMLEAFAKIVKLIPNAHLVVSWNWIYEKDMANSMNSMGFLKKNWEFFKEEGKEDKVDIRSTAINYGIPNHAISIINPMSNHLWGQVINQCHCAIHPSRAEGGTNLVAMETIACGLPTVLANNTGHRDLLHIAPYLQEIALYRSLNLASPTDKIQREIEEAFEEWGWADPEEIVQRVVEIHKNYEYHSAQAKKAAVQMSHYSWENQINMLLDFIYLGKMPLYQRVKVE